MIAADVKQRLLLAREKLRGADSCIEQALSALAEHQLMSTRHGLPNHARIRMNARIAEIDAIMAQAALGVVVKLMEKVDKGVL